MLAGEWSRAMQDTRSGSVRDFVAVGDVDIQVIGADAPVLDSEVPVRQILEQVVAKTGIPPFMLGLSWSSTERMSSQQADLLTTEITAIRRNLTPVVERICRLWLRMHGYGCGFQVVWDDINLQDQVEEARAELYRQQARKLRLENDAAEAAAQAAAYCLPMDGLPDTGGSSLSGKERGKGRCPGKEKCSDGGHKSGAGCLKPAGGKGNSGPVGVGL